MRMLDISPVKVRQLLLEIASQTARATTTPSPSTEVLADITGFVGNLTLLARNISNTTSITTTTSDTDDTQAGAEDQVSFLDVLGILAEKISSRATNLKTLTSRTMTTASSTEQPKVVADITGFIGNLGVLAQNISTPEKDSSLWNILHPGMTEVGDEV